jgi:hypothetical protein
MTASPEVGKHIRHGLLIPAKEMSTRRPYGTPVCIRGNRLPHAKARG